MEKDRIDVFNIFNAKFDEFIFQLLNKRLRGSGFKFTYDNSGKDIPFIKFNIYKLLFNIQRNYNYKEEVIMKIGYKLVDIKMSYAFLKSSHDRFYQGIALIVGNNEIEKLNPNTISILQQDHYLVYIISILYEQILSTLQLIYLGKIKDYKKNQWNKIYESLDEYIKNIITKEEHDKLNIFKESYRTSELHKYSAIRGFLSKEKWDHFQDEEKILEKILERFFEHERERVKLEL